METIKELKAQVKALENEIIRLQSAHSKVIYDGVEKGDIPFCDETYRLIVWNWFVHDTSIEPQVRVAAGKMLQAEELHQAKMAAMRKGKSIGKKPQYASSRIPPMESEGKRVCRDLLKRIVDDASADDVAEVEEMSPEVEVSSDEP